MAHYQRSSVVVLRVDEAKAQEVIVSFQLPTCQIRTSCKQLFDEAKRYIKPHKVAVQCVRVFHGHTNKGWEGRYSVILIMGHGKSVQKAVTALNKKS